MYRDKKACGNMSCASWSSTIGHVVHLDNPPAAEAVEEAFRRIQ